MTYQIIYSSQSTAPLSLGDLEAILVDARAGNERRNVTGALVYVDGVFLQILEGDKQAVLGLMRSIAADTRHTDVKVFHEGDVERPLFSNWRMAYVGAQPDQMAQWAGLQGTASIETLVKGLQGDRQRTSQFVENLLKALAG